MTRFYTHACFSAQRIYVFSLACVSAHVFSVVASMSSSVEKDIRARLAACRDVLPPLAGTPNHEITSRLQCNAILDMVRSSRHQLSTDQRATLAETFASIPWHGEGLARLLGALNDLPDVGTASKRSQQQNYESLMCYLTVALWDQFLSAVVGVIAKADMLLRLAASLGCWCPQENTYKIWTAMLLLATNSTDAVLNMDPAQKKNFTNWVKKQWIGLKRHKPIPDVAERSKQLPNIPVEFHQQQPRLYEKQFPAGAEPVVSRMDANLILQVAGSWHCRGEGKQVPSRLATVPTIATPSAGAGEQLLSMLVQTFQRLQNPRPNGLPGFTLNGPAPRRSLSGLRGLLQDAPFDDAEEEESAAEAAAEKATLEEAAAEKVALEKARERAALEKTALKKAAIQKAVAEMLALEKAAAEKAALEKAAAEEAALEKAAAEQAALEKAPLKTVAAEKAALTKVAAEAAALKKAAAEKRLC